MTAGTAVGKPKFLEPLVEPFLAPDGELDGEELLEPDEPPLVLVVVEVEVPLADPPALLVLVPVMTMVP